MTISSQVRKAGPFLGTGAVSEYPFYFTVFRAADLLVVKADANGAESTLVLNSDYTVNLNADQDSSPGGTVTLTNPLPADHLLVITSALAALQPTDLTNQGGFYPQVVNASLDRLTILIQQLKEKSSRSVMVPITSDTDPVVLIDELVKSAANAVDASSAAIAAQAAAEAAAALVEDASVLRADIAASTTGKGAQMVGYRNTGVGSSERTVAAKLADVVHVADFGAVGGATDDTAAFQAALTAVGNSGGGTVFFTGNHRILGNLTVPLNTTLCGPLRAPGQLQPGDSLADYENLKGVLRVSSAVTITTLASAGIASAIIMRDGLALPFADHTAAADGIAAFAGTAVTAGGADCRFVDLLFLGFARAIDSNNHSRLRFIDVQGDCTNGISVRNSTDITRLVRCHFWPFTTANFSWTASDTSQAILCRSGIAYELADIADWAKATDCFSYGYFRGFRLSGVDAVTLTACSADGPVNAGVPQQANSIGVLVENNCLDTKIIGATVAGKVTGYWLAAGANTSTELVGSDAVACTAGINIALGDVKLAGGLLRSCGYGIDVNSTSAKVHGVAPRIMDSLTSPIRFNVVNNTFDLRLLDIPSSAAGAGVVSSGTNWQVPSVASADPLNLPINGSQFLVTGTTNFGTLNGGYRGREVTLIFNGVLTALNGGSMRLASGANFTSASGSTLTLIHNGAQWYEKGRAA